MGETLLAFGVFGLLAGAGALLHSATPAALFFGGAFLVSGGLLLSVPCAVRYHLRLRDALRPRGRLDRRWLWNPAAHHVRLTPAERGRVLPWFYAGAAGWAASIVGCALVATGLWISR